MRVILYTGKGGVGKTCVASATALKIADSGKKVMIISTDQAHSLSDALGVTLTNKPTSIVENLDALEIDVVDESERAWGNLKEYMKEVLTSKAQDGIETDELLVFPGLEELFALFKILDIYEHMDYDVLIVDCAPTGETLALLKYPEMFGGMIERILPMKRKMLKTAGPIVEKVMKLPMPEDNIFDDIEGLMDKLERLQKLMINKEKLSVRIVTTPEKIVIKETKRNYTWLQLYDYNVDGVVVNKVYPKEALDGYFNKWVDLQGEGLEEIKDSFGDVPVLTLNLLQHELKGTEILRKIGGFYGEINPVEVLAVHKAFTVLEENGRWTMEVSLPFADKSEMDLGQAGGELHIAVKNEKRCISLPKQLNGKEIAGAKFGDGVLRIEFV